MKAMRKLLLLSGIIAACSFAPRSGLVQRSSASVVREDGRTTQTLTALAQEQEQRTRFEGRGGRYEDGGRGRGRGRGGPYQGRGGRGRGETFGECRGIFVDVLETNELGWQRRTHFRLHRMMFASNRR